MVEHEGREKGIKEGGDKRDGTEAGAGNEGKGYNCVIFVKV